MQAMASIELIELKKRIESLSQQFLPAENKLGIYTDLEQDQMRALRMLVHAEIESYLESICRVLLNDLDHAVRAANRVKYPFACWASMAAEACRAALKNNNGIKDSDVTKMFSPLGITQDHYDSVSPLFLDKMKKFGANRGDVAHQSALRATYSINQKREKAAMDELMKYISSFDKVLISHRLKGFH